MLTVLTILFLFSLPLIISCAGPDPKKVVEQPSFSGTWDMNEDWTGCDIVGNKEGSKDYTVEITQNGDKADLREINGEFIFECNVNADNHLLCDGEIRKTDGGIYSFGAESYTLWFSGDDSLHGKGDWTYTPPNGDSCKGSSVLTAMRANNNNN